MFYVYVMHHSWISLSYLYPQRFQFLSCNSFTFCTFEYVLANREINQSEYKFRGIFHTFRFSEYECTFIINGISKSFSVQNNFSIGTDINSYRRCLLSDARVPSCMCIRVLQGMYGLMFIDIERDDIVEINIWKIIIYIA